MAENNMHGVKTRREANRLDAAKQYKLMAELDKNREEYGNLTLAAATQRLSTVLGFVLTDWNVRNAAGMLELKFRIEYNHNPTGNNKHTAGVRADLDAMRADLDAMREELAVSIRMANELSADIDAGLQTANEATIATIERLNEAAKRIDTAHERIDRTNNAVAKLEASYTDRMKELSETTARTRRLEQRVDTLAALVTQLDSKRRTLLGGKS